MTRVFISYRRSDSAGFAGRLYEHLSARLGDDAVFMDIDSIPPGADFVDVIRDTLAQCSTVLVMIGPHWLEAAAGRTRRIDDPNDFVRLEIKGALQHPHVRVIPVLVNDAIMPNTNDLPADLHALTRRNAVELSNARFAYDVDRLVEAITGQKVHPDVPPRPDRAGKRTGRAIRAPRNNRAWWVTITQILIVLSAISYYMDWDAVEEYDTEWFVLIMYLGVIPGALFLSALWRPLSARMAGIWTLLLHLGYMLGYYVFRVYVVGEDTETFGLVMFALLSAAVAVVVGVLSGWRLQKRE